MSDAEFDAILDEAVRATGVERYRHLCSEANTLPAPNSRDDYRRFIAERRWAPAPAEYPPLLEQAGHLAGAIGRAAAAVVKGEPVRAPRELVAHRRDVCRGCDFLDRERGRCTKCGCGGAKLHLLTESCPDGRW